MGFIHSLYGIINIELISADIPGLLTLISRKNISIFCLQSVDEITVQARVLRTDYKQLYAITQQRGDKLTVTGKKGIYWHSQRLVQRPLLLVGLVLILLFSLILPSRILFVQVQGNSTVPSKMILEMAEECGISIFASRRKVRSEKVKNALLEKVPTLEWIGVNTSGCIATISVTEKTINDMPDEATSGISSIVASRDGVIWECTVLRGNQLCKVGQAVKAGQTLVSGYTDCGIAIKSTRAKAEIYAQTIRDLQVITPEISEKRDTQSGQRIKYSLKIGKKLIKLYKDSGISDTRCVKMYTEYDLELPGDFVLPVTLIKEVQEHYDALETIESDLDSINWLEAQVDKYLLDHLLAGEIQEKKLDYQIYDGYISAHGEYICEEMIGQFRSEELIENNGKRN